MLQRQFSRRARLSGMAALLAAGWFALSCPAHSQGSADKIVLWVNGEFVNQSEFFERLQRLRAQDFIASVNPLQVKAGTGGQLVMNSLITERLILQWAAKTKALPSEEEINTELESLKKQSGIAQLLADGQLTEDFLKYDIKVQRARFNMATNAATISPKEVEDYYKKNIAGYTSPERWELAAIRTAKPTDVPKIQADLKAGKPFTDVVKAYSDEPNSREKGGQLGTFFPSDPKLPAAIRSAVAALKVGEVTPPIKIELDTGAGQPKAVIWWFMRLLSKQAEVVRPFSEVKQQVERLALLERAGGIQVADKKITEFRKQSEIKIGLPGYQSLLNPPKKP